MSFIVRSDLNNVRRSHNGGSTFRCGADERSCSDTMDKICRKETGESLLGGDRAEGRGNL